MTDSTTAVYAVIESASLTENEVALPSFDSPVYNMAETPSVPPPSHGRSELNSD
jgi:hypothetical protein